MNLEELNCAIKERTEQIQNLQKDLTRLKQDKNILVSKQCKFQIGDKVRLTENLDTPENHKRWPGWSHALHFMNPSNPAIIVDISCYYGEVFYIVKFDNQTCIRDDGSSYEETARWHFYEDQLERVSNTYFHKFNIGDRVKLKYDLNTSENVKDWNGNSDLLKFMNPDNPATVITVDCSCSYTMYGIRFDYQQSTANSGETMILNNIWQFREEDLQLLDNQQTFNEFSNMLKHYQNGDIIYYKLY